MSFQLIETAALAAPDHKEDHGARVEIYGKRREEELSLMSKGIFGYAERESRKISDVNE